MVKTDLIQEAYTDRVRVTAMPTWMASNPRLSWQHPRLDPNLHRVSFWLTKSAYGSRVIIHRLSCFGRHVDP